MTPEEWSRLTPAQQQWHHQQWQLAQQHRPPPVASRPTAVDLSAPTRRSRAPFYWFGAAALVILVLAGVGAAAASRNGGTSTPASATDSCRGSWCSATATAQPAAAQTAQSSTPDIVADGPPRAITAREWAKIAKDPAAHTGNSIVVYGQVKQFDSVTGTSTFRASVDGVQHRVSYGYADYETNTILQGDAATLGDLVEGDLFRADVVVAGTYTYETTLGGHMTAPVLAVSKIQVTGSAK